MKNQLAMRNRFVMLFIVFGWCCLCHAQPGFEAETNKAVFPIPFHQAGLPEVVLKILPRELAGKVAHWQVSDNRGRQVIGWYANGKEAVAFAHKRGHLHGKWQAWYENGRIKEEGYFKNGYPDGPWKFWFESGVLRSERNFSAVKMQSMTIASRQRNPRLQFLPSSGKEPSSKETISFNPLIFEATHGGLHFEMPFRKAVHEGEFVLYAEDGTVLESGKFSNGLRDGQWLYRNKIDNTSRSGYYSNGVKHGPWKEMQGENLLRLDEYKDGALLHRKHYGTSPNGRR